LQGIADEGAALARARRPQRNRRSVHRGTRPAPLPQPEAPGRGDGTAAARAVGAGAARTHWYRPVVLVATARDRRGRTRDRRVGGARVLVVGDVARDQAPRLRRPGRRAPARSPGGGDARAAP